MSYYVSIRVGGAISATTLDGLLEAAVTEQLMLEQCDQAVDDVLKEEDDPLRTDLESFLDSNGLLSFYDSRGKSARIELIEDFCRRHLVPYLLLVDGDAEADGQAISWVPGMQEPRTMVTNLDHVPVATAIQIQDAVNSNTIDALVAGLTLPTIPPLTIEG